MVKHYALNFAVLLACLAAVNGAKGQLAISGTVYDISKKNPIEAVSVLTTSGRGTITDSVGRYSIVVRDSDSIYFSFLNKPTPKFAVRNIQTPDNFDISIMVKGTELPNVTVKQKNYTLDSLENRSTYAKVFNFKKPGLSTTMNPPAGNFGVGLDLDELISIFQFRKNKRTLAFQKRLLQQEQENFVDHRYSKSLVRKLTGLSGANLDSFMVAFRPTYEITLLLNDLEFGHMIQIAYQKYRASHRASNGQLRLNRE
ncbi:hypothetical protein EXU57_13885 [Segetibacter sp. 3557_3]|uniref:hypothetical protein n=1 Tax=Segetibacter sp. 3557_3 TaxID=2547429 RepID=UPI0010585A53|nr:hypothetical protein [Segetibacter sp. 3557_3]TDH25190.1 hypothetical protein EXU57_13885 [Segetibacter sp. 3557_3]